MKIHSILLWLRYYYNAQTIYDLDSPFIVELIKSFSEKEEKCQALNDIENLRHEIKSSNAAFERTDLGAGNDNFKIISVKDSLKSSSTKSKCQILFKISQWAKPSRILELGTHFGFGSIALSSGACTLVDTIEGDPFLSELASKNLEIIKSSNINIHLGAFDEILPKLLSTNTYDLFYVDGFHAYDATIRFTNGIISRTDGKFLIIYDDIYWSKEMFGAWQEIKKMKCFNYSLEYFGFGLIGYNPDIKTPIHKIICPTILKPFRMGFLRKSD